MIAQAFLTEWGVAAPWPSPQQIEQDLILSRMVVEIANDPLLGRELAFRGGTCLHKLHLPTAARYSEDLDYVRTSDDPRLGDIFTALRTLAVETIGLREHRRRFPTDDSDMGCIWFDTDATAGGRIRIKIETNVAETTPYLPHAAIPYQVDSRWWSGSADVLTLQLADLLSTKLRALYQRRKGRDLFDLWIALTSLGVDDAAVVAGLRHYMRTVAYTYPQLRQNLTGKLHDGDFLDDLAQLVTPPTDYAPAAAVELILERLGAHLRNAPTPRPT